MFTCQGVSNSRGLSTEPNPTYQCRSQDPWLAILGEPHFCNGRNEISKTLVNYLTYWLVGSM
jgi:hypothetical protein